MTVFQVVRDQSVQRPWGRKEVRDRGGSKGQNGWKCRGEVSSGEKPAWVAVGRGHTGPLGPGKLGFYLSAYRKPWTHVRDIT